MTMIDYPKFVDLSKHFLQENKKKETKSRKQQTNVNPNSTQKKKTRKNRNFALFTEM